MRLGRPSRNSRLVVYGLLSLFALFFLAPLYVMLMTSFKTLDEIRDGNMMSLPGAPTAAP
jgi:glucose/mannose transport system permease protein